MDRTLRNYSTHHLETSTGWPGRGRVGCQTETLSAMAPEKCENSGDCRLQLGVTTSFCTKNGQ